MLGASPAMREIFAHLEKVAPSELTCLITGETGTGKEMVARALHNGSARKPKPFVVLDCGSIPRELVERRCSATRRARSPAPARSTPAASSRRTAARSCLDEIGEVDNTDNKPISTRTRKGHPVRKARQRQTKQNQGRRPRHRRHEPRSRKRCFRRHLPPRFILPTSRPRNHRPRPPQTQRRYPRTRRVLPARGRATPHDDVVRRMRWPR